MEIHSTPIRTTLGPVAELDRLVTRSPNLSAHLEAATARLLDLIREFDEDLLGACGTPGLLSCRACFP